MSIINNKEYNILYINYKMLSIVKSTVSCRKYQKLPPNIVPVILQVVPEQSILGSYVVAHIIGYNFSLGGPLGYSTVTFGNITNIPITFFSSLNISFVVPVIDVTDGIYNVRVVNNRYPAVLRSNLVPYTLFTPPEP
jgi:hypothetical protein